MSDTDLSTLPSLARAFEGQRSALRKSLGDEGMSAPMVVTAARRALDATGTHFTTQTEDAAVQKAGLWLLEMVKSGAGILDQGAKAEIIWREVPKTPSRVIAGSTVFYGAAAACFVAGMWQGTRTTMITALVLALLRFFDPKDWKQMWRKIPLLGRKKKVNVIEGPDGKKHLADARIIVDSAGFVDGLADALRTADHILIRMSEPVDERHWRDDARVMGLMQGLLEAKGSGDGDFALRLIETELSSVLRSEGIEAVDYSRSTARLFDILPGLELESGKDKTAAPALISGDQVLRRGTVWSSDA